MNNKLKVRTKLFALTIIKFVQELPKNYISNVIGGQLLRAGTSVGANYRAACRARSQAEFISKMGIVEEEADESIYWIEILIEAELIKQTKVDSLLKESNEILAMTVASIKTARKNR
jgi:four helix bundle protein